MAETNLRDAAYPPELKTAERLLLEQRPESRARPGTAQPGKASDDEALVGFALSGGGVRSATFCLGLFQALAGFNLLGKIDYISSVSGGGYFASFLGRLFRRDDVRCVQDVEEILNPDMLGGRGAGAAGWKSEVFRWLRDNGRYLAPKGAGDLLLDLSVVFRNWVAIQVVITVFIFLILLSAQLLRVAVEMKWGTIRLGDYLPFGQSFWWSPYILLSFIAILVLVVPPAWAYWLVERRGPWRRWQLPPVVGAVLAVLVAAGVVFFSKPAESALSWLSSAATIAGILAILCWLLACWVARHEASVAAAELPFTSKAARKLYQDIEARNRLSSWLKIALAVTVGTVAFALIDSAGQTLYASTFVRHFPFKTAAVAVYGALAAVAPFAKWLAAGIGQKPGAKGFSISGKLLTGSIAAVILILAGISLDALSHAIAWKFDRPTPDAPASMVVKTDAASDCGATVTVGTQVYNCVARTSSAAAPNAAFAAILQPTGRTADQLLALLIVAPFAFVFCILFGWTWSFLNRSSLQALYSARLTRAYLGASNRSRLESGSKRLNESDRGDDIDQAQYWAPLGADPSKNPCAKGAPLHLVNVTINETLDARSQVQLQDRKGLALSLGPASISAGIRHHAVFDVRAEAGKQYENIKIFPTTGFRVFEYPEQTAAEGGAQVKKTPLVAEPLSLGAWTGISGAAFSTGRGSGTSLGSSLLAGFFNVRLGYWWNSGVAPRLRGERASRSPLRVLGAFFNLLFPVQTYLLDEFLARFHGTARKQWYLSDGGHFENLGAYELVRRRLPMIVVIDAEEDPDYTFDGLANLVRKARLDFDAEVRFLNEDELDQAVSKEVRKYFGALDQLRRGIWAAEPIAEPNRPQHRRLHVDPGEEQLSLAHAALARIYYGSDGQHGSTLLYVKPTLIGDEPADVLRYHSQHPDFPQQSTADQFFDEAQWESYRRLAEHIGHKLFSPVTGDALFHPNLLRPLPPDTGPRL